LPKRLTTDLRGHDVMRNPLLNKGSGFTAEERERLGLTGILPWGYNDQGHQARRIWQTIASIDDPLARYRELAALQDRNEHLYYRVLMDHLAELMPIVYTPTVGLATRKFSEVFQRGRGLWVNPAHRGSVREVLANATGGRDIALTVVTDNESILGIGDQGAGGIAISIGKLALYTAGAGIDPARTLPVSLDVGTDNPELLENDLYLGWREARLRGAAYDELVEEFVDAFVDLFPNALIQWEDFRKDNALAIVERYRRRVLSFNDDIQGTGAVTFAGVLSALRVTGERLIDQRIVVLGAGAAGLGIARQIKVGLAQAGVNDRDMAGHVALLDSRGLIVDDQPLKEAYKAELAWPAARAVETGLRERRDLAAVVECFRPTVLIGTSGQAGAFTEALVRSMAKNTSRPVIMPLSNPTANAEAVPADLLRWTDGRAQVATGSPFAPVRHGNRTIQIGQGNNVFVFPALGLGALVSGAREVTDGMITAGARALAGEVTDEELASGLLFPDVRRLREVTAVCATAVARRASEEGVAARTVGEAEIREAMWWPDYPEFV
jgi:malic enzyme